MIANQLLIDSLLFSFVPRMIALQQYAGPANWFITISISDSDMKMVLRMGDTSSLTYEEIETVKFSLPTLKTRHRLLTANPYLAATSFELAIKSFYDHLLGLPMVHGTRSSHPPMGARKIGIFGKMIANGGPVELQGRGTLHLHVLLITPASAMLVQQAMRHEETWECMRDHVDSIVRAHIDEYELSSAAITTADQALNRSVNNGVPVTNVIPSAEPTSVVRDHRYTIPDDELNDLTGIRWLAARVAAESNVHHHTTTCFKHANGICRMGFNRRQQAYETVLLRLVAKRNEKGELQAIAIMDNRADEPYDVTHADINMSDEELLQKYRASANDIVVLELYRPPHSSIRDLPDLHKSTDPSHPEYYVNIESKYPDDDAVPRLQARIVPYNEVLSAALKCNTSVEFLGSISQATTAMFYLVKYLSKGMNSSTNILPLARQAITNALKYGSMADDATDDTSGRDQKLFEQKLLNLGNKSEYSAQMAALGLRKFPSNVFSHEFVFMQIRELTAHYNRKIATSSTVDANAVSVNVDDQETIAVAAAAVVNDPHVNHNITDVAHSAVATTMTATTTITTTPTATNITDTTSTTDITTSSDPFATTTDDDDIANANFYDLIDDIDVALFEDDIPQADDDLNNVKEGSSIVFDAGSKKFVSNAVFTQNYLHRGADLQIYSPYEYAAVITVRQMTSAENEHFNSSSKSKVDDFADVDGAMTTEDDDDNNYDDNETVTASTTKSPVVVGRKANAVFRFDVQHPLYNSHVQQLRSLHRIPITAGAYMRAPSKSASLSEKNRFAAYVISLHTESNLETGLPAYSLTYDGLLQLVSDLRTSVGSLAKCRLRWIQLRYTDSISSRVMNVIRSWRHQFTYRTHGEHRNTSGEESDANAECNMHDDDVVNSIQSDIAAFQQLFTSNTQNDCTPKEEKLRQRVAMLSSVHAQYHLQQARTSSNSSNENNNSIISSTIPTLQPLRSGQSCPSIYDSRLDYNSKSADVGRIYNNLKRGDPGNSVGEDDSDAVNSFPDDRYISHPSDQQGIVASRHVLAALEEIDLLDTKPDPTWKLNMVQSEIFTMTCDHILAMRRHRISPMEYARPDDFLLSVQGGGGVGKSHLMGKIIERVGADRVCATSLSANAARLFDIGQTIHSAWGIRVIDLFGPKRNQTVAQQPLWKYDLDRSSRCRLAFVPVELIFIDEISMCPADLFYMIHTIVNEWRGCTSSAKFGQVAIIVVGDFFQLDAVGGESLIDFSNCPPPESGQMLFKQFKTVYLTEQMRVSDPSETDHRQLLVWFRSPHLSNTPVAASNAMSILKPLTTQDIIDDPQWLSATIAVNGNEARNAYNKFMLFEYARNHGLPVISWVAQMTRITETKINNISRIMQSVGISLSVRDIVEKFAPHGIFYFAQGAPVTILDNIAVSANITNGTLGNLHSITLSGSKFETDEIWREISNTVAGTEFQLGKPPLSINVEFDVKPSTAQWVLQQSLVPGRLVIPFLSSKQMRTSDNSKKNLKSTTSATTVRSTMGPTNLKFVDHSVDLSFATTYHRIQGRTIDRVILDFNGGAGFNAMNVQKIFVGISRVRKGNHLRVINLTEDLKRKLNNLTFSPKIVSWFFASNPSLRRTDRAAPSPKILTVNSSSKRSTKQTKNNKEATRKNSKLRHSNQTSTMSIVDSSLPKGTNDMASPATITSSPAASALSTEPLPPPPPPTSTTTTTPTTPTTTTSTTTSTTTTSSSSSYLPHQAIRTRPTTAASVSQTSKGPATMRTRLLTRGVHQMPRNNVTRLLNSTIDKARNDMHLTNAGWVSYSLADHQTPDFIRRACLPSQSAEVDHISDYAISCSIISSDHSAMDLIQLDAYMYSIGRLRVPVRGCGACLFRCFAIMCPSWCPMGSDDHDVLRQAAVNHIRDNRNLYAPHMTLDIAAGQEGRPVETDADFEQYLDWMSKKGHYGGEVELKALATITQLQPVIFMSMGNGQFVNPEYPVRDDVQSANLIELVYHGRNHYDLAVRMHVSSHF